ncbi:head maturation protease, ClpP-related [Selenomonas ruminantium]|uniref:ATP-dependent Clp protease proteolytic subunit n=1 Tax=Selenomonas ruminantium TaxID=971 RepID=A0A1K1M4I6_SELRU|nr:head maturation protease, ClpP-related [Selenomonas ruminantium]SFW18044.1 ATP-dependent Clp protease, protease subunit [Selenomonas ruminantium]
MKCKFWNWVRDADTGERTLVLNGQIAENSWFGDEVTPAIFRDELMKGEGNITVWINSPGGDVFAAAQIYNMLMDYKGSVTVRIDGLAASAASVIAMAGTTVEMSPVGMLMIHNPSTAVIGNTKEMQAAIQMLDEVKESILNAYELKTGRPRQQLSDLMDVESWMNAKKAVELGFADKILFANEDEEKQSEGVEAMLFSQRTAANSLIDKIKSQSLKFVNAVKPDNRVSADALRSRLNLLIH